MKSSIKLAARLALLVSLLVLIATTVSKAETINCPEGFTCIPITQTPTVTCPAGFVCTPTNISTTATFPIQSAVTTQVPAQSTVTTQIPTQSTVTTGGSVTPTVSGQTIAVPITGTGNPFCSSLTKELKFNDSGSDVVVLQTKLISSGFDIPAITTGVAAKGFVGNQTVKALKEYQQSVGLTKTGVLDTSTLGKMKITAGCDYPGNVITVGSSNPVSGSTGSSAAVPILIGSTGSPIPLSGNHPPKIVGFPGIPTNIQVGQKVNFSWTASDADNDYLNWSIDWGDGVSLAGACRAPIGQISGSSQSKTLTFAMSHTWSKSGIYTVKVSVSDCRNGSDSTSLNIQVGDSVNPTPTITLLSPNGGEVLVKGSVQDIKWQDNKPYPSCSGALSQAHTFCTAPALRLYDLKLTPFFAPCVAGSPCPAYPSNAPYTIAKNISGLSHSWSVGSIALADDLYSLAANGSYTIQVCESNTDRCDLSDSAFKITIGN